MIIDFVRNTLTLISNIPHGQLKSSRKYFVKEVLFAYFDFALVFTRLTNIFFCLLVFYINGYANQLIAYTAFILFVTAEPVISLCLSLI